MKQITPEIKARIAALYYGQSIMQTTIKNNPHDLSGIMRVEPLAFMEWDSQYFLNVARVSSITDEDAIEVANIATGWNEDEYLNPSDVPYWLDEILTGNCALTANYVSGYQIIDVIDCLRSKGYALPAFGYSVDELAEAGVFKIKEVNND